MLVNHQKAGFVELNIRKRPFAGKRGIIFGLQCAYGGFTLPRGLIVTVDQAIGLLDDLAIGMIASASGWHPARKSNISVASFER